MSTCKYCGREIRWIKTWGGSTMPCDIEEVTYWADRHGKERIVTPDGLVKSCRFTGRAENASGIGYHPHWSTCEKSKEANGKKGK